MMKDSIEKKIISMVERKCNTIFSDTNIHICELGLDSIQYIELIVDIEQTYQIEFEEEKLFVSSFEYLVDLVEYVKRKCEIY